MTLGRTRGVALQGIEGALVDVEADLEQGLPKIMFSGLPDAACRQAPDRIKAAAMNSGFPIPNRRLTVNLSPASIPKVGSGLGPPHRDRCSCGVGGHQGSCGRRDRAPR